ncbi:MAG: MarR family winged helix-turn-helix transcriptional regulator [Pseudomonadota bacterium]
MDQKTAADFDKDKRLERTFGRLGKKMLSDTPLMQAWRLNFVANFFTGPLYRDLTDRFDLSRPEFVILLCLSQMPGILARDVCDATGLPKNSISRAVSSLLEKGLIERQQRDDDRRSKTLVMTEPGRDLLAAVVPIVGRRQEAMLAILTPAERDQFERLMERLVQGTPDWVHSLHVVGRVRQGRGEVPRNDSECR